MIYNTFRIQYADSVACVFYYIAFTEYIISGNTVRLYKFILRTHRAKESASLHFRLKEADETKIIYRINKS